MGLSRGFNEHIPMYRYRANHSRRCHQYYYFLLSPDIKKIPLTLRSQKRNNFSCGQAWSTRSLFPVYGIKLPPKIIIRMAWADQERYDSDATMAMIIQCQCSSPDSFPLRRGKGNASGYILLHAQKTSWLPCWWKTSLDKAMMWWP